MHKPVNLNMLSISIYRAKIFVYKCNLLICCNSPNWNFNCSAPLEEPFWASPTFCHSAWESLGELASPAFRVRKQIFVKSSSDPKAHGVNLRCWNAYIWWTKTETVHRRLNKLTWFPLWKLLKKVSFVLPLTHNTSKANTV